MAVLAYEVGAVLLYRASLLTHQSFVEWGDVCSEAQSVKLEQFQAELAQVISIRPGWKFAGAE